MVKRKRAFLVVMEYDEVTEDMNFSVGIGCSLDKDSYELVEAGHISSFESTHVDELNLEHLESLVTKKGFVVDSNGARDDINFIVEVNNWEDLAKCESPTHTLKLLELGGSAWLTDKVTKERMYLSTHTFYDSQRDATTELLQKSGFKVKLVV